MRTLFAARKALKDLKEYVFVDDEGIFYKIAFRKRYNGRQIFFTIEDYYGEIAALTVYRGYNKDYTVEWSKANKGFGPLIYDWAMETLTAQGFALGCDLVTRVSPAAQNIWNYYLHNRKDTQHQPILDWSNYTNFEKSLNAIECFGSISSVLEHANKENLINEYPILFDTLESGISSDIDEYELQEEFYRFKQEVKKHNFFEWAKSQGVFYVFKKPSQTIENEIQKGIEEGWLEAFVE